MRFMKQILLSCAAELQVEFAEFSRRIRKSDVENISEKKSRICDFNYLHYTVGVNQNQELQSLRMANNCLLVWTANRWIITVIFGRNDNAENLSKK